MEKKHRLYLILVLLGVLMVVSAFFLLEGYIIPLIGGGTNGESSSESSTFNIVISVETIAISVAAGILVGVISVLYPALKVTRVNIVEVTSPPTIGAATRFMILVPVSVPNMIGIKPMIVVATVMSLGRTRSTVPS